MENTRLFLTKKDNFYVIEVYENSDEDFKKGIYFPYLGSSQEQVLQSARSFGETLAKNLSTVLEEDKNV